MFLVGGRSKYFWKRQSGKAPLGRHPWNKKDFQDGKGKIEGIGDIVVVR